MEGKHCNPICIGMKMIVLGIILAANEYYFKLNWYYLIAGLLVLKGLMIMIMKGCCCKKDTCCTEEPKAHKKK